MDHPLPPLRDRAEEFFNEKDNKLFSPVCQERPETILAIEGKERYHTTWIFFVTGFVFILRILPVLRSEKIMAIIRMDMLAEVYSLYKFAGSDEERDAVIGEGLRKIFLRLDRYTTDSEKFAKKSLQAIHELEAILERFYHQDSRFLKLIHSKAQVYIVKKKQKREKNTV